ncbi:hypothetical protein KOW79_000730 [Hemibagrus wyckioides]|uniref:Uncharacterized protein n=1 Tax=Hemibagrus wyckioides TaxID=337641 RepID=A0A9D3STE2_9TELE|nr:hypothetical protein KOW79_000730 [Hemibagrus wyckioides]
MGAIDVAACALLVAVCLLSTAAPSLAVYSNGECTFNTKANHWKSTKTEISQHPGFSVSYRMDTKTPP